MNYRHAFHAGNFADVVKHAVLARVLTYMKRKSAPFRVIDTHAGCGRYDLHSLAAGKTGEWEAGIGRLMGSARLALAPPAAALLEPYFAAVSAENGGGSLQHYPGSPRLALRMMREDDRLLANELHPEDARALKAAIGRDRRARVMTLDAWVALRALLPPPERRAVVLIDPPFEAPGELERITNGLAEALERFATGIYLAWYPIKDLRAIEAWQRSLEQLATEKILLADFLLRRPVDTGVLNGCGLVLVNSPFTLADELAVILPELVRCLGETGGKYQLRTSAGGATAVRPAKKPSHNAN